MNPVTKTEMNDKAKPGRSAALFAGVIILVILLIAVFDSDRIFEWVKSLHIIAIISWMVGLLYLPRLFVYHADVPMGSDRADMLSTMEMRLMKVIMTPAMIISWVSGLYLATVLGFEAWLWVKLLFVIGLTAFHMVMAKARKQISAGISGKSALHWRIMNEVPTLGLIVIVIMVVVKPF